MTGEQRPYLAYMLRLWQTGIGEGSVWRASLESPHTGERQGFASLEMLFAFLEERTGVYPRREQQSKDGDKPDPESQCCPDQSQSDNG
jgi:hypothetical protein